MSDRSKRPETDVAANSAQARLASRGKANPVVHALFRHPHAPVPKLVPPAARNGDEVTAVETQILRIRGQECTLIVEHGQPPRGACLLLTFLPTGKGSHHWEERIAVMLMPDEVLGFLLVLTGAIASSTVERNNGSLSKKVMLQSEAGATYASACQGRTSHRLALGFADTTRLAVALLAKFRATAPESVRGDILTLIRLVGRRAQ